MAKKCYHIKEKKKRNVRWDKKTTKIPVINFMRVYNYIFYFFLCYLLILVHWELRFWTLCARQIVTKASRRLTLKLQNKSGNGRLRNLGAITVHAEETVSSRSVVEMILRCSRLDNKDVFSKSVLILHPIHILIIHVPYLIECRFIGFVCLTFEKSLIYVFLVGPFSKNIKNGWEWRLYSYLQDWSYQRQFKSKMETSLSWWSQVWK